MNPWLFLPIGYLITIAIETPVLLLGLSPVHPPRRRLLLGIWLTASTYPIVILVLPYCFEDRFNYLLVAETFAPLAECVLFLAATGWKHRHWPGILRDCAVITLANLASFGIGEVLHSMGAFDGIE